VWQVPRAAVTCDAPFSRRPRAQSTKRGKLKRPGEGGGGVSQGQF